MDYEEIIVSTLKSEQAITALVGSKVYALLAPANARAPYVVTQEISVESETAHDGPCEVDFVEFQLTAWADTLTEALAIRREIRAALEGVDLAGGAVVCTFSSAFTLHDEATKLRGALLQLRVHCQTFVSE